MTLEVDRPHIDREHDFSIKVGNTTPALGATLKDNTGTAIDLTGHSVEFHMREIGADTKTVDAGSVNVTSAADGEVAYEWSSGDTDTSGEFIAEFVVDYSGGDTETFPRDGYITIEIDDGV